MNFLIYKLWTWQKSFIIRPKNAFAFTPLIHLPLSSHLDALCTHVHRSESTLHYIRPANSMLAEHFLCAILHSQIFHFYGLFTHAFFTLSPILYHHTQHIALVTQ
jgi:hypothetical protein